MAIFPSKFSQGTRFWQDERPLALRSANVKVETYSKALAMFDEELLRLLIFRAKLRPEKSPTLSSSLWNGLCGDSFQPLKSQRYFRCR